VTVAATGILGHMFPIYLNFKGGKGVATSLGVLLGVYPYFTIPVLFAFGLWIGVTLITRYISVASISAAVAFPVFFAITVHFNRKQWGGEWNFWPLYLFGVVLGGLVVYRHRSNLRRLCEGTESRIGSSKLV
jgi:glycerol-3-phosphate acyltransferase PlsY